MNTSEKPEELIKGLYLNSDPEKGCDIVFYSHPKKITSLQVSIIINLIENYPAYLRPRLN